MSCLRVGARITRISTLTPVTDWQPLSRRNDPEALAELAVPQEGVPPWLRDPISEWLTQAFRNRGHIHGDALKDFQLKARLSPPFDWRTPGFALQDAVIRAGRDPLLALDLVDYALHHSARLFSTTAATTAANDLAALLISGGSAWEVVPVPGGSEFQLARRATGPIRKTIAALPPEARAAQHLTAAWNRLAGREPDASVAYREAVRAVEAAAKATILPDDSLATMGKMIKALKEKPEKWTTRLGSVETVRLMMESVWKGQLDRHGTDDESVPLNVSAEEADAAVTTCVTLVRLFVGGHISRVAA
jgi:hypothetical protein